MLCFAFRWLTSLEEEFFRQGDKERELGIPISPLFDRSKQGVSKSQGKSENTTNVGSHSKATQPDTPLQQVCTV